MFWRALLVLLIAASVRCFPGSAVLRKVSVLEGRIVNGEKATPGEFPSQLSLQRSQYHQCGASIVNERWALTAAHCVEVPDTYEVVAGSTSLTEGGTRHTVTVINRHQDYNPSDSWINDIAVVRVSPAFPINGDSVAPIQLPSQGQRVPDGANVTVIGWGDLWYQGPSLDDLQKVQIQIVNQRQCEAVWKDEGWAVHPTQICAARFEEKNYGSCHGDSGGPLFYQGAIVGLVSWGYECATPPYPTVYTRVPSYVDWIIERTNGTWIET